MKLVIQRVSEAQVRVRGETVARIGPGFLVLLGAVEGDT
ncbi:MAG: D-aminoacyl-tRNA deacylase, partial [Acidobacteriota bacterium]|nr:D-aminoacyl-tRNA deacylase [Acidobacteriota bacterium]